LVAVIVVSGWGCSGSSSGTAATTGASSTTPAGVPSAGEVAIVQFGGGNGVNADFAALEEGVRSDPDGLRAAAMRHLGDTDEMVHYAAVYALARTATSDESSMSALRGLLASARVDDRLLAAGALVYRGESSGIPVLIGELDSPEAMALRDPPQTASGFARQLLLRFTNEDFGLRAAGDDASAATAKPAWQQWWDEHGAGLQWDPTIEEFR
jgi:hypothetical protein